MQLGQDLTGIEREKAGLIRSDLVHPDVCIARLSRLRDRRNVAAVAATWATIAG
jgi:hypothetical protein